MRHIAVVVLAAAAWLAISDRASAQAPAAAARPQTLIGGTVVPPNEAATINGTVVSPTGEPLTNVVAQARNLLTAQISGSTETGSTGAYTITNLPPGIYVMEIVDVDGQIIGVSAYVAAAAGATVAASITATSGILSAVGTVTGLAATLTTAAAESVKFAAAAAGVAGVVAPPAVPTASPSR
ncbi:MAG: hypothetical protein A3I61_01250 [Acidobacteria bacterium RIFCSPLOWO2_02_FULL_68_18]|nr:MAG: hypothetical protein A3I61_01250 [Acidobacteria bacterium RIFCSPLOWO2_02_FULL_68_18]OFW51543.1 MAG: hypothetical protein A3G77_18650 [Acidobacteria bacterium RIFCSPLOWO2_12_FULL_68_19]